MDAMSAWSVKTRPAPSRHYRDTRVYDHTTGSIITRLRPCMKRNKYPPQPPPPETPKTPSPNHPTHHPLLRQTMEGSLQQQKESFGFQDSDVDDLRRLISDTNVYLLIVTLLASTLHLLFEVSTSTDRRGEKYAETEWKPK